MIRIRHIFKWLEASMKAENGRLLRPRAVVY